MKYARILLAAANEIWAMQPEKLRAVIDLLAFQALGGKFTAEEIASRISKQEEREVARKEGAVAILPLRGVIANRMNMANEVSGGGGTSSEKFAHLFQGALREPAVKAIVLDIDSPGGVVHGSDELSTMIFQARGTKPIVAHVNSTMASAAYWIGSAADEIVMTSSAEVGSIGVMGIHDDISKSLATQGLTKTVVSAGKFKGEGSPFEPLSEEARAHLQSRVDAAYNSFVKAIARNRNVAQQAVREGFGQGRMVDSAAAVTQGMADRVATLDETLQRFGASLYPPAPKAGGDALQRRKRALALNHAG